MKNTVINSNGSKWAGEDPDSIEKLIEVLKNNTIEERFFFWVDKRYLPKGQKPYFCCPISEDKFNDEEKHEGFFNFFGNFEEISHVFSIDTNDPKIIRELTESIQKNKGWLKYYNKNLTNQK